MHVSEMKQISIFQLLSSIFSAGAASGFAKERAFMTIQVGMIFEAGGPFLEIVTTVKLFSRLCNTLTHYSSQASRYDGIDGIVSGPSPIPYAATKNSYHHESMVGRLGPSSLGRKLQLNSVSRVEMKTFLLQVNNLLYSIYIYQWVIPIDIPPAIEKAGGTVDFLHMYCNKLFSCSKKHFHFNSRDRQTELSCN